MKSLILLIGLLMAMPATAQICNDAIRQNAFLARYQLDADPLVVIDDATGLEWQRCSVGFVFNDNGSTDITAHTCDQPAENSDSDPDNNIQTAWNWNQAIERAAQEGNGWRLPNHKELTSLIEFACHSPAINVVAFPNTLQSYWTSTPNATTDSAAWSIDFTQGTDAAGDKLSALGIRLVRDTD